MLLAKKQYIGISIAALIVSPIIFEIYMALDTSALFSHCVFCTFRWADPKRCTRICVLHEWWRLWIFHGEVVWKYHHHTICPQGKSHMYNISISCLRFLNSLFCVSQLSLTLDEPVFSSSLWGPSCDPLDQVVEHCLLPELAVGDWLIFSNMGASGQEGPATLSDTDQPPVYYTISTDDWWLISHYIWTFVLVTDCFCLPFFISLITKSDCVM